MGEHSPIGASGAYRWFPCPGSVALCKKAPPEESSEYAERGTGAHWVHEECLNNETSPYEYEGRVSPNDIEMDYEDVEAVDVSVQFIREKVHNEGLEMLVEAKFELKDIHPDAFGTADTALYKDDLSVLYIYDYKHGKGVPVNPYDNRQLMYYALGAIRYFCQLINKDLTKVMEWGDIFKKVVVGVIQPRCDHKDGAIREWVVPAERLTRFAKDLKEKAYETERPDAILQSGDHCRWCNAKTICPKLYSTAVEVAKQDFKVISDPESLSLPAPEQMTAKEISKIMRMQSMVTTWLSGVNAQAKHMLENGEEIEGYKLVKGIKHRKWKDADEAADKLNTHIENAELFKKKIITPAQAEKHFAKNHSKIVDDLCFKPEGAPQVAPEWDKRKPIQSTIETDFEVIEERK